MLLFDSDGSGNGMDNNINSFHESDDPGNRGSFFSKDINKDEEQMNDYASIDSNGSSNGIRINFCEMTSSKITESISYSYVSPVHEGDESINCKSNDSLKQKEDGIGESSEVLDDDESIEANQKNKRVKLMELLAPQTSELEMNEEHQVVFGLVTHSENRISEEVVEDKLSEGAHCLGHQNSSNNDDIYKNRSEICDAANDPLVSTATQQNESPRISSGTSGNAPVHCEEQDVGFHTDLSMKHSQDGNASINVAASGSVRKKLLVLDVNGLLVDISSYVPYDFDHYDIIRKKAVFKRPYCDDFLKFCFERFNVGVWTSRTKWNMEPILDFVLKSDKHKLLFSWDQSQCTDTGYYTVEKRHKPLLLKKLKKLWDKCDPDLPWERGDFNETNTLLLDDTPYKALTNPPYTAIFPYSYRFSDVTDNSLGPGGNLRVYLEGLAAAENVQDYVRQNPFGQKAITEKNLSWGYFRKVIAANSTPPRETENDG